MEIVKNLSWENFANSYGDIAVESANMIVTRNNGTVHMTPMENAGKRGKMVPTVSVRYKKPNDDILFLELLGDNDWNIKAVYEDILGEEDLPETYWKEIKSNELLSVSATVNKGVRIKSPFVKSKFADVVPKVSDKLEVGAILYDSWGWEQTNIDFYCVVQIKGKFVTLLPLSSEVTKGEVSFMSNKVVAGKKINFLEKEIRREWRDYGSSAGCSIRHGWCSLWSGEELTESHYA